MVEEEEAGAEVVGWAEEATMDEKVVVIAEDAADVDAIPVELGPLEAASALEVDEAGTRVEPGAIGGTGVATWSEVGAGAGVEA